MAITKVNVLIDGGFFARKFLELNNRHPKSKDVISEVGKAMDLVRAKTNGETSDILFRIYYYDCEPFGKTIKDKKKLTFLQAKLMLHKLYF